MVEIERNIVAWVTRVDMFILSAWPFVLLVLTLMGAALFAWTVSECVIRLQDDSLRKQGNRNNADGKHKEVTYSRGHNGDDP